MAQFVEACFGRFFYFIFKILFDFYMLCTHYSFAYLYKANKCRQAEYSVANFVSVDFDSLFSFFNLIKISNRILIKIRFFLLTLIFSTFIELNRTDK